MNWLLARAPVPDVIEAGRVMAQLDDWRALMFVMLFMICVLMACLVWAFGKLSKAVEAMVTLREAINGLSQMAAAGARDAADNRNALISITTTIARVETDLGVIERHLEKTK